MILAALLLVGIVAAYTACVWPTWFWTVFACSPILLRLLAATSELDPNTIAAGAVKLRVSDPGTLGLAIGILYYGRTDGFRFMRYRPVKVILVLIASFLAVKVFLAILFGSASSNNIASRFLGGAVGAVGEVRDSFIGLIAPMYAVLAARHLKMSRMKLPFVVAICAILIMAAIQIARKGMIWSNHGEYRFLAADEALTLTLVAFVLPFLWPSGRGRIAPGLLAFVALGVAVLANSRSVWLAAFLGAVILLVLMLSGKLQFSKDRSVRALYVMVAVTVVLVIGLALVFAGPLGLQSFADEKGIGQRFLAFTDTSHDPDSSWRQELWRNRIEQVGDDWPFGRQLGDRRLTLVGRSWLSVPDHNGYITTFELGGVFLLGLAIAYWGALAVKAIKLLRTKSPPSISWQPALALAIVAMSLSYSVAYDFPSIGAVLATMLILNGSGPQTLTNARLSYRARQWAPSRMRVVSQIRTGSSTMPF